MLVLLLAGLMVSTIRYASFKGIPWGRRQHSLIIVAVGLLVWSIVVYSEIVLLLIAATYTAAGLTIHVVRLVRHRLVSRTA
jgi:phosphatidylserine synthase